MTCRMFSRNHGASLIIENEDNTEPQPLAEDPIEEQPQEEEGQPPVHPEADMAPRGNRSPPRWFWSVLATYPIRQMSWELKLRC